MPKPRTQKEIDQWNAGARLADSTWWQSSYSGSMEWYGGRMANESSAREHPTAVYERLKPGKGKDLT